MAVVISALDSSWAPVLRRAWASYGRALLWIAVALMLVASVHRLTNEFWRLLWETGRSGAIDLQIFHDTVHRLFAGAPVYHGVGSGSDMHPPATYVLLGPLLGWLDVQGARWLWAITTVPALVWLVRVTQRAARADGTAQMFAVGLVPLAIYATSATIGNGQLIVHLMPALLAGFLVLQREASWQRDLLAAGLIVIALLKPTVSAPLFWLVVFAPRSLRPAVLVVCGYSVLTAIGVSLQDGGAFEVLQRWADTGVRGASGGRTAGPTAYANIHSVLRGCGLSAWNAPASLAILAAAGLWTRRYRSVDPWILAGLLAIVARFWTYHRLYDDLLILLPMIALFRLAKRAPDGRNLDVAAALLLAITWAAAMAPARLLSMSAGWHSVFEVSQSTIWIAVLVFLACAAQAERAASGQVRVAAG